MDHVVPQFIDELIAFSAKDKKKDKATNSDMTISLEPDLAVPQEDPKINRVKKKNLKRH
jgi:hypothetical protein